MFLASLHKQLYVSRGSRGIVSYSTFCYLRFQSVNLALICTPCGQVWHPSYLTDLGNLLKPAVYCSLISVSILSVVPRSVYFVVDITVTLFNILSIIVICWKQRQEAQTILIAMPSWQEISKPWIRSQEAWVHVLIPLFTVLGNVVNYLNVSLSSHQKYW